MSEAQATTQNNWFYEENGQRKGPVSENEMVQFIKSSVISHGTSVLKQGFPDWLKVENTDLRVHLDNSAPPPLSGEHINNTLVWVLAFAPLIGYFLEWVVAGAVHGGNEFAAQCIDPAVSAQVRPLMQMPQREFSCSAPDADADGCKSQSSPR